MKPNLYAVLQRECLKKLWSFSHSGLKEFDDFLKLTPADKQLSILVEKAVEEFGDYFSHRKKEIDSIVTVYNELSEMEQWLKSEQEVNVTLAEKVLGETLTTEYGIQYENKQSWGNSPSYTARKVANLKEQGVKCELISRKHCPYDFLTEPNDMWKLLKPFSAYTLAKESIDNHPYYKVTIEGQVGYAETMEGAVALAAYRVITLPFSLNQ